MCVTREPGACGGCDLFPVHCRLLSSQLPSADQRQTNLIISELIQPVTTLSG